MRVRVGVMVLALVVSGCATTGMPGFGGGAASWSPTIDARGVNQARYEQDFSECRSYAEANTDDEAARDGGLRAGLGLAALTAGAAVATGGLSLLPMVGGSILAAGAGGALAGASSAQFQAQMAHRQIIIECLEGRGYNVLN